ncbi:MAG: VanZ family protein [Collinsella sp.]
MKIIIGWTAIALFAATLVGIWVLTEQNAVETSLLSESTARVVEGQATGVQAADATGEAQTENGMTGGTDSAASNIRSGRLASIRMWVGTNVRRVAHTVEFFFVGLFASVVVVCFSRRPWSVYSRCVPVLLFCAACSVGDQVHKIFVPGRHFDVIDLGFDAAGYVTAMLLVLLAAALVRHATRPIGAHARR